MGDTQEMETLRPVFTRTLAGRLQSGASLNLTAPHGFGRRRTLQDLRRLLPQAMRVLYADMKLCAADFRSTLSGLCSQAALEAGTIQDLGQLIDALGRSPEPALLILHNLGLLRSFPHDPRYDTDLLPHLGRIAAHPGIGLLTVSESVYPDWPLPCEPLPLPPIA